MGRGSGDGRTSALREPYDAPADAGQQRHEDVAFIGWFGPRGLASVIFALLTLESLEAEGSALVAVISLTVLISVLAHGITATPLANRFRAPAEAAATPGPMP